MEDQGDRVRSAEVVLAFFLPSLVAASSCLPVQGLLPQEGSEMCSSAQYDPLRRSFYKFVFLCSLARRVMVLVAPPLP